MGWRGWRARRAERDADALRKGRRAAEILRRLHWQCWRDAPAGDAPPLDALPETPLADLIEVLPAVIESGSVGLVWPRLWHRAEELGPAGGAIGAAMRAAYEAQVAHNAGVARDIGRVVSRLREHGVEPVLIKGYAMARLYPSPLPAGAVRTAGDIDLVVRDGEYDAAREALADRDISVHGDAVGTRPARAGRSRAAVDVDLHTTSTWKDDPGEGFFGRTARARIGGVDVLVPSEEDHLRILCLHFLRHGGARPVRLCDISLLVEGAEIGLRPIGGKGSLPLFACYAGSAGPSTDRPHSERTAFNWERVMAGTARHRRQVAVTLQLAYELLGAAGGADLAGTLPQWLVRDVLRQWAHPSSVPGPVLRELMTNPRGIVGTFQRRWPTPTTATVQMGMPFNRWPRLPIQMAAYAMLIGGYAISRLPRQAADRFR